MWDDQVLDQSVYVALADSHDTPLFVYNGDGVLSALDELRNALHPAMEVFFSLKANPNVSICALLASHGAHAEVSSLAELVTALQAGIDPKDVIFLGPGKSAAELRACVEHGIYAVVAESLDELADLDRIAAAAGIVQGVLLRVNPARSGKGSRLTMGGRPRQFGIDEAQLLACPDLPARYPRLDVLGIHGYFGTRILDAETIADNTREVFAIAERVAQATGITLRAVDVGGGLGVAYFDGEHDPDLGVLRARVRSLVSEFLACRPGVRLLFEAGRYLTARAGAYVVRVRNVKESMGERFVVTDGGTHHHMAAVGVGSPIKRNFPVRVLGVPQERPTGLVTITGPLCTPNDSIAAKVTVPLPNPGDLVAVLRSGAYGPTASPTLFLSHGYPAEVLVRSGQAHLVRSRDTLDDLLRKQQLHRFPAGGNPSTGHFGQGER